LTSVDQPNAVVERVFDSCIEKRSAWVRSQQNGTAPGLGRGSTSRSDDGTLPKPPRGFCLGFGLAKGQVVITGYRQIIPVLGATTFRDPSCDSDPAGPVQEAV